MAENNCLDVPCVDFHYVHVAEDARATHAGVKEDRTLPAALPRFNQRGKAVFGNRLRVVKGIGTQRPPRSYIGPRHQNIDGIIHDELNVYGIYRGQGNGCPNHIVLLQPTRPPAEAGGFSPGICP